MAWGFELRSNQRLRVGLEAHTGHSALQPYRSGAHRVA